MQSLTVDARAMEKALWYLFAGTRGGETRARLVESLRERPRNANQLAERVDLEYNTVRYHLELLEEHDVVEPGGADYGTLYFLTDRFDAHRDAYDAILDQV